MRDLKIGMKHLLNARTTIPIVIAQLDVRTWRNTQTIRGELIARKEMKLIERVDNIEMMEQVTKIRSAPTRGARVIVEDLKKVEDTEGALQSMLDVSPFEKSTPYLEVHTMWMNLGMSK